MPRFVEGLGHDVDFSESLLQVADSFKPKLSKDGRKRLKRLILEDENLEVILTELERLAKKGRWLEDDDTEATAERHTILELWWGRWLVSKEQYDKALQIYLAAERRLPAEADSLRKQLGRAFNDLSEKFLGMKASSALQSGLKAAQRAVALDTENVLYRFEMGRALVSLERGEEALANFQEAIKIDPDEQLLFAGLGITYESLGNYDEAIIAYQRVIELDPKISLAYSYKGDVYQKLDRYEEAKGAYERAIELDPQEAYSYNGLGNVYRALVDYEAAKGAYEQAIELDPKYALAHNGLGNVYRDLGQYEEAKGAYERAIELDPQEVYPHNGLGRIYRYLGRYEEAIIEYAKSVKLEPSAESYTMLGTLYQLIGRLEDSLNAHRQAVELEPDEGMSRTSLAAVLRKLGQETEAEEHLARARELIRDDDYYNRACLEAISGNPEVALDHLTEALSQDPRDRDWARQDPDLESLRGQPRFEALVGKGDG